MRNLTNEEMMDLGRLRPYIDDGKQWVTLKQPNGKSKKVPLESGGAILPFTQWIDLDEIAVREFRRGAPVCAELIHAGCHWKLSPTPQNLPEFKYEAEVFGKGGDAPQIEVVSLPLVGLSEQLDPAVGVEDSVRQATQKLAMRVEDHIVKTILGCSHRIILNWSAPPLERMLQALQSVCFYGPYKLLQHSGLILGAWGHSLVQTNEMALVQMTPDTIRIVEAAPVTVIQVDGAHYVYCSYTPQIRTHPKSGQAGICHWRM